MLFNQTIHSETSSQRPKKTPHEEEFIKELMLLAFAVADLEVCHNSSPVSTYCAVKVIVALESDERILTRYHAS